MTIKMTIKAMPVTLKSPMTSIEWWCRLANTNEAIGTTPSKAIYSTVKTLPRKLVPASAVAHVTSSSSSWHGDTVKPPPLLLLLSLYGAGLQSSSGKQTRRKLARGLVAGDQPRQLALIDLNVAHERSPPQYPGRGGQRGNPRGGRGTSRRRCWKIYRWIAGFHAIHPSSVSPGAPACTSGRRGAYVP
jgi:hypothetical protein